MKAARDCVRPLKGHSITYGDFVGGAARHAGSRSIHADRLRASYRSSLEKFAAVKWPRVRVAGGVPRSAKRTAQAGVMERPQHIDIPRPGLNEERAFVVRSEGTAGSSSHLSDRRRRHSVPAPDTETRVASARPRCPPNVRRSAFPEAHLFLPTSLMRSARRTQSVPVLPRHAGRPESGIVERSLAFVHGPP